MTSPPPRAPCCSPLASCTVPAHAPPFSTLESFALSAVARRPLTDSSSRCNPLSAVAARLLFVETDFVGCVASYHSSSSSSVALIHRRNSGGFLFATTKVIVISEHLQSSWMQSHETAPASFAASLAVVNIICLFVHPTPFSITRGSTGTVASSGSLRSFLAWASSSFVWPMLAGSVPFMLANRSTSIRDGSASWVACWTFLSDTVISLHMTSP